MTLFKTGLVFLLLFFTTIGHSQNEQAATYSIEIDPATFGFKGYAFHLRFKPKNSEHAQLGLGVYAMDLPDVLVDLNKENKDKNWNARINKGFGLFGEYHFSEVNSKWFVGSQLAAQQFKIENKNLSGSQLFTNGLLMGYAGYTWKVGQHFYIKPWAGIGYTTKLSGENVLDNLTYDIDPMMVFATLHLGYTF